MAVTAKDLKGTTVRKQLDAYAKAEGMTPKQKGDLTKKFLANINNLSNFPGSREISLAVGLSGCFIWADTTEGWNFWNEVDGVYVK